MSIYLILQTVKHKEGAKNISPLLVGQRLATIIAILDFCLHSVYGEVREKDDHKVQ